MSQGPLLARARQLSVRVEELKLPPVVKFAAAETRERAWPNVITCHNDDDAAYTWSFERRAISEHILTTTKRKGLYKRSGAFGAAGGRYCVCACVCACVCVHVCVRVRLCVRVGRGRAVTTQIETDETSLGWGCLYRN